MLFLMHPSRRHFFRFWSDLVPKSSIWGAPWCQLGSQEAPKVTQVAPNGAYKSGIGTPIKPFLERRAAKIALGTLLGIILIDFGSISIDVGLFLGVWTYILGV